MSAPSPTPTNSSGTFRNDNSPPTSLAVTIFIAAFAVIFALFGGFLVIGLVKRRRNPERYGPRPAIPGRAKQTRKKGLAMAVLESIPVVRFGANNKTEEGVQKDVELSGGRGDEEAARTSRTSREITVSSPGADTSQPPPAYQSSTKDAENGTGTECSICIADFIESEEVRVLPCHHRFHPACIDPWLLNVSGTCPICRYDLQPAEPIAPVEEADSTSTPVATPATAATLAVPSPTAPRDRTSFRSRLRDVRQSALTGPEYISALRHLHHDHERIRGADVTPQEPRPTRTV